MASAARSLATAAFQASASSGATAHTRTTRCDAIPSERNGRIAYCFAAACQCPFSTALPNAFWIACRRR